jgi:hypothetical protein
LHMASISNAVIAYASTISASSSATDAVPRVVLLGPALDFTTPA